MTFLAAVFAAHLKIKINSMTPDRIRQIVTTVINDGYIPSGEPEYNPEKSLGEQKIIEKDIPILIEDIEEVFIRNEYALDLSRYDVTIDSTLDFIVKAIQLKLNL